VIQTRNSPKLSRPSLFVSHFANASSTTSSFVHSWKVRASCCLSRCVATPSIARCRSSAGLSSSLLSTRPARRGASLWSPTPKLCRTRCPPWSRSRGIMFTNVWSSVLET